MLSKICKFCEIKHERKSEFCSIKCRNNYKYNQNKDQIAIKYQENKETILKYKKEYYIKNKEEILKRNKLWKSNNTDWIRSYHNNRVYSLNQKLSQNLRSRLSMAINGNYKAGSAISDLGCSIEELKKYLEDQFQEGMTWDNWGRNGWHIDHIKPLAKYNLEDKEEFKEACNYKNLQPLWAKDNLSKGAK